MRSLQPGLTTVPRSPVASSRSPLAIDGSEIKLVWQYFASRSSALVLEYRLGAARWIVASPNTRIFIDDLLRRGRRHGVDGLFSSSAVEFFLSRILIARRSGER